VTGACAHGKEASNSIIGRDYFAICVTISLGPRSMEIVNEFWIIVILNSNPSSIDDDFIFTKINKMDIITEYPL
jgi:hypothetical protein